MVLITCKQESDYLDIIVTCLFFYANIKEAVAVFSTLLNLHFFLMALVLQQKLWQIKPAKYSCYLSEPKIYLKNK